MLVGIGTLRDGAHMQARLVRERGVTHVRSLRVERHVHQLGDVMRDGGEPLHAIGGDRQTAIVASINGVAG